ncbi:MAG: helix-turn-helix domain-containing protein [Spirillospora sp.]
MLRQLREESGHTLKTAGRQLERSPSSLSLIENGVQWLRLRDLGHILDQYNASLDVRAAMMTLGEQDRQPAWWDAYKDLVTPEALDYASVEHSAAHIMVTETTYIPGLLQTEGYANALHQRQVPENPPERIERWVAFRLERQQRLQGSNPPQLDVVLDEAALRRMRGGRHIMRSQLRRLLNETEKEYLHLHVLPLAVDPGTAYGGQFDLLEIGTPAILSIVLTDHLTGRWILEGDKEVAQYRDKFEEVRSSALCEDASRAAIDRIISEL